MARKFWVGSNLMLLAGALGAGVGVYDFYTVATGIDGTGGVELVIVSCLLMMFGAVIVKIFGRSILTGIFTLLLLLDVIGTGTAAYFLESNLIMAAMALAALGWILQVRKSGRTA